MQRSELVIIGGGPAGHSAGLYASRAAMNTVLVEGESATSLTETTDFIENYPGFSEGIGGRTLMSEFRKQSVRFGVKVLSSNVQKVEPSGKEFIVKTSGGEIATGAVIIATGASPRLLGIPGEEKYTGRGVSYCATCDGAFFRNKTVAIVGGGDSAVEEALFLTRFAQKVYVIHRRGELKATKLLQQRAFENGKIELVWNSVAKEVQGGSTVKSVLIRDVRTDEERHLSVDGIFIYVGYYPKSDLVKNLVNCDGQGYIITDGNMQTSFPGIFAAGDVRQKLLRQVITAAADGAIAAVAAEKYLESNK